MKKAQILSVIALAAALGVVAPVASANAFTAPSGANHGTASCADAAKAVKAIEANARYANIQAFRKAVKDVPTINDVSGWGVDANAVKNAISDTVNGAMLERYDGVLTVATNDAGHYLTSAKMTQAVRDLGSLDASDVTIDDLKTMIDAVKATKGYTQAKAIYDAIKNNDQAKFNDAVVAWNKVVTTNIINANTEWANAVHTTGEITGQTVYNTFAGLIRVTDAAQDIYDAYAPSYKAMVKIWNQMVSKNQVTPKGIEHFNTNFKDAKFVKLQDLGYLVLAHTDGGGGLVWNGALNALYVANTEEMEKLEGDVDTLTGCYASQEDGEVYDEIITAAYNYGRINGIEVASDSQKLTVAKSLVSYSEPKDETETDTTIDAPASGILGMAEGSASAVSIAAGLATALTALGAGVVAYRSARRNK